MASSDWDDSEYPYHARYVTGPAHVAAEPRHWQFPWQAALWWVKRGAAVAAGTLLLALVLGALFGHRIIAKSILVAQIQARGCDLTFLHQMPGESDPLHPLMRKAVGDEAWSEVAELSYFANAFRWNNDVDDVQFICTACRRLEKLRSLALVTDAFSMDQIKDLPQLAQLEQLEVGSLSLADGDLATIRRMNRLKSLKIRAPMITVGATAQLASLPNLESLELYAVKGDTAESPNSTAFPALKRLVIKECSLDDQAIVGFGPLPVLEEAELGQANLSDQCVAHLLASPVLQSLIVNDANENDIENAALVRCPGPAIFHLAGTSLTDRGLSALEGRTMTSLVVDGTQVTDAGLEAIGTIRDLRYLSLRNTSVTGIGANYLQDLSYLTQLDLQGAALSQEGVNELAKLRLDELLLSGTLLTDEGLMLLADNDSLRRLDTTGSRVTPAGLRAFYEARKGRLKKANRTEALLIITEHAEVVAEYVDPSVLSQASGEFGMYDLGY